MVRRGSPDCTISAVEAAVDPIRRLQHLGSRIRFLDAENLRKFRTRLDPQPVHGAGPHRLSLRDIVAASIQFSRDEQLAGNVDADRCQASPSESGSVPVE